MRYSRHSYCSPSYITVLSLLIQIHWGQCTWKRFADPANSQMSMHSLGHFETKLEDRHPLDPLTPSELRHAKDLIKASNGDDYWFHLIELKEPLKSDIVHYFLQDMDPPPGVIPRKAFIILKHKATRKVFEAIVNLDSKEIESFINVPGVQLSLTFEEQMMVSNIVLNNSDVQKRCAQLGWTDLSLIDAEPWLIWDYSDFPEWKGERVLQVWFWASNFRGDNYYAHPFDFAVLVNMDTESVLRIIDWPTHDDFDASNKEGNIVPRKGGNYNYTLRGGVSFLRTGDKPITVTSPDGPSFLVNGYQIRWQKWKMRVGFNRREGLVLHTISYNDSGKVRPILYRASLVELFVSYGDPRPPYHRQMYYDNGFAGMGLCANKLVKGEDIIGAAQFMDGFLNNATGDPIVYKDVVSIREEDAGILWKHVDYRTGKGVVVRSHRLVISFTATVSNYEYIFNWCFYQDGSMMIQAQMTGIVMLGMLAVGVTPTSHGTVLSPQLNSMYHQHFFTVRLDMDIDGQENTAHTLDTVALPDGTNNPYVQGLASKDEILKTPSTARTNISPESHRFWAVTNDKKINPLTKRPVSWKLIPPNSPPLIMKEDSPIRAQAGYLNFDTWVTKYMEGQLYPAGDYVYMNDTGLPKWVEQDKDANLVNADLVIWHTFGLTHIPRVEDFPVMPIESTAIWLRPNNFFVENPGLDVPPFDSN